MKGLLRPLSDRLVEVFCEKRPDDPDASLGSGFLLDHGLILTARHVLMPKNWRSQSPEHLVLTARPLALAKKSPLKPAEVRWPRTMAELSSEDAPDIALIRLAEVPAIAPESFPLGLGEGERSGVINVFAGGFPNWRANGSIREVAQITGRIPTLSGARAGRYEVTALKMEGGRDFDNKLDWRGMSGAALFSSDQGTIRIIGVLVLREESGRIDFLAARLDDDLLARNDLRTADYRGSLKTADSALSRAELQLSDRLFLGSDVAKVPSVKHVERPTTLQLKHLPSRIASPLDVNGELVTMRVEFQPADDYKERIAEVSSRLSQSGATIANWRLHGSRCQFSVLMSPVLTVDRLKFLLTDVPGVKQIRYE